MKYGGRWATGVPPGLQNQCGALIPSRMGSIPICSRQIKMQKSIHKDLLYVAQHIFVIITALSFHNIKLNIFQTNDNS